MSRNSVARPNGPRRDSRDAFAIAMGSPRTQIWPASGFQLGIAIGQIPMSWALCDRSSTALIPRSRLDVALRQTICIAGPLKSPPEAHAVTPSRSPRCHYASVTSVTRFPTRDHHRMGLVAVEGLQQFIHRADPWLETGRLWFPPEAPLEHFRDRNTVSMGSLTSTAMVTCGGTSEDIHSALTSGVETRSEAEGKIKGRPLI